VTRSLRSLRPFRPKRAPCLALALGLVVLAGAPVASASDATWRTDVSPAPLKSGAGYTRRSFYVDMRDGVPIAVDLYLPAGAGEGARVPALLRMTRYWRAVRFRALVRPLVDEPSELARAFLDAGYAWLDVDVRGSGASGGVQASLWSDDEVRDGAELVDWIVRQPWSSGLVGALGDSYDGTAAELLLANRHPAVRAVAPRFALFDGYTDIGYPGGLHLFWFTKTWGRFNDAIDRGALFAAFPAWVPIFISGPRPIDAPDGAERVREAQRAHEQNFDVHAEALATPFRDDLAPGLGLRTEDWSPYGVRRPAIETSGAAVFSYSGWLDGAYAHAAIKRFRTLANPGQRLLLGPWNHGGDQRLEPLEPTRGSDFDHAGELLRFFNLHLKSPSTAGPAHDELPVTWFTTGAGRWNHAPAWPPPAQPTRLYLAADSGLSPVPEPAPAGSDRYETDPEAGSGDTSRWRGLAVPTWTEYPDRAQRDRHLRVYETAPLASDLEVTGHPLVHLTLRCDQTDGAIFAYLEDVAASGEVGYVSEGVLRASQRRVRPAGEAPYALSVPYHSFARADAEPLVPGQATELVFDLQPISHRFRRGHRIRLALSGADRDQFAALPGPPPVWTFERGAGSWLELPVVESR
jgi:putative CocE/NonD family hydrolase